MNPYHSESLSSPRVLEPYAQPETTHQEEVRRRWGRSPVSGYRGLPRPSSSQGRLPRRRLGSFPSSSWRRRPPRRWPPGRRPGRRWPPRPRPPWRRPLVVRQPLSLAATSRDREFFRWVQSTLGQVLGTSLPVTGIMDGRSRAAVREFQRRQGLPEDGIVGPDTERALVAARGVQGSALASAPAAQTAGPTEPGGAGDGTAEGEEQFLGSLWDTARSAWGHITSPRIEDRTHLSPEDKRKGQRKPGSVYALVLHQMAFSRGNDPRKYDRVTAHFTILPDGKITQLHPVSSLLWASNGFNKGSVAVEFAGNFPNTRGRCWQAARYGCHRLTPAQIEAGRYLIRYLMRTMGLTHVLAHRQSSGTRENDPGPDIWYHVGQWAIDTLGLKDGGPGFKVGSGKPIPTDWRTWGRRPGTSTP